MIRLALKTAERLTHVAACRALLAGMLLGATVRALAAIPRPAGYGLAMALVMLAAGAASMVLHALHERGRDARWSRAERNAAVHRWLGLLGCGVLLAVHGLDALLG